MSGEGFEEEGVGTCNQKPSRIEREDVSDVNMKWKPGGRSFMPWKLGEVVKERRLMPQRIEEGRERRRIVGV